MTKPMITRFPIDPHVGAFIVGVVSDTHIPDRVSGLHPALLQALRIAKTNLIFHLGDICAPWVLKQLSTVSPVLAVRGNRDWLFWGALPWQREVEIFGTIVSLQHGQGTFWQYWSGKLFHVTTGYQVDQYLPRLIQSSSRAKVLLFGHTHFPECFTWENRLVMNPGSASVGSPRQKKPTFGVLTFQPDGNITGRIEVLEQEEP